MLQFIDLLIKKNATVASIIDFIVWVKYTNLLDKYEWFRW